MNEANIIRTLIKEELIKNRIAMEFNTKKELEKYLKEHPNADRSKHTVKNQAIVKKKSPKINMDIHKKGMKKVFKKIKNWSEKEKDFFRTSQELPHSESRSKIANLMKRKSKGFVKKIKHEVKEWKEAANAVKKLVSGKKINDKEKDALKAVATHVAITTATLAVMGHLHPPLPDLVKHLGTHLLEHSLLLSAAKASLFAMAVNMSDDEALEKIIKNIADAMENIYIPPAAWEEIVTDINKKRSIKNVY